jgi:hypothetical protein
MVGGEDGEEGGVGEEGSQEEFVMTPGAAARAGFHEDTMSEDSVANTPRQHHSLSSPSPASSDDTGADAQRPASQAGASSSAAAAAFTTAVINDVAPQMFRVMVGRCRSSPH